MFVIAIIAFVIAAIAVLIAIFGKNFIAGFVAAAFILLGAGLMFFSTFYQNGAGEAKVIVNSVDKTIQGTIETPGSGFKSPLDEFVDFDLFSQQLTYAGGGDSAVPSYTGGTVNGAEITANVGGVNGGSTRANIDLVATYSLGSSNIADIYSEFRSQERFTEQIVSEASFSPSLARYPSEYSAIDFRGTARGEAETKIREQLNERLKAYGVEFTTVTIQDVRYSAEVEQALTQIEQANQQAQTAEANQRTKQVEADTALIEAQGRANAQIEEARGEAEANRLLNESLTPTIVELRRIEALQKAAESGNMIIDNGDGNLLVPKGSVPQ